MQWWTCTYLFNKTLKHNYKNIINLRSVTSFTRIQYPVDYTYNTQFLSFSISNSLVNLTWHWLHKWFHVKKIIGYFTSKVNEQSFLLVCLLLQKGSLIFITVDVPENESIDFDFTLLVFLLLGYDSYTTF